MSSKAVDTVGLEFYVSHLGGFASRNLYQTFRGKLSGEIVRPGISTITVRTLVKVLLSMLKRHLGLSMSRGYVPRAARGRGHVYIIC